MTTSFDKKTIDILYGLYQRVLKRKRPIDSCIGCHVGEIKCYEEGNKEHGYCSEDCQIVFHSFFYNLGQKKAVAVAIERPDFRQLLELVDEPVIAQIIAYTYPHYKETPSDMRAILNLRGESQQLKELIDLYILKEVRELSSEITDILNNDSLLLFPNLQYLSLTVESEINFVGGLTSLENLEVFNQSIGNDSLFNLQKLTRLAVLNNHEISSFSLSRLTKLEFLLISKNDNLSDDDLSKLPTSINFLSLNKCPEIHNTGLLSLSRLSRLETMELKSINVNDQAFSKLSGLKDLKVTSNENFLGDHSSLGNMRLLNTLYALKCPNFEANGLRYKTPLRELIAPNTKITNSSLSSQINLTVLDVSNTEVTDDQLSEFFQLKNLSVRNSQRITGECFSKLTRLEFLDLSDCSLVTRSTLSVLVNLEELYLDRTSMRPTVFDTSLKLTKLRILSLIQTQALRSNDLLYLTNLVGLSLSSNDTIQGMLCMRNLGGLLSLDLSYNTVIMNKDLYYFSRLQEINLTGNTIINSSGLTHMPNLKEITLRDGSVTDEITWVDYV